MFLKRVLRQGANKVLNRRMIFVTGAPRSGTSMITKVIDAAPDTAILMENNFGNRRRHWMRVPDWESYSRLRKLVTATYAALNEQTLGNKICTPDVWSADDISMFCGLFSQTDIVFAVRDPLQVCLSRYKREDFESEFTPRAREYLGLDFKNRFTVYTSSWQKSLEAYYQLRDEFKGRVHLLYYEDFCSDFEAQAKSLFGQLRLELNDNVLDWRNRKHHDQFGNLVANLKYEDGPVRARVNSEESLLGTEKSELARALETIGPNVERWKQRTLTGGSGS